MAGNRFRPTLLEDAAFDAVKSAPGLYPGGHSIISNPTTRTIVEVSKRIAGPLVLAITLAGCGPATVKFLTDQGIQYENINDPLIFPNDERDLNNPLDNAKSVEFVMYTNPKDNLPYLAIPVNSESGINFEQRQVRLLYSRDKVDSNKIAEVNMIIADDENPQNDWWQDKNARTTVVSLKLNQLLTEDVLKQRTGNLTNDDIIGDNPLFSQIFARNPFTGEAITMGLPPESTDVAQNELLAQKVALLVTGKVRLNDRPILIPTMSAPTTTVETPTEVPPTPSIPMIEVADAQGNTISVPDILTIVSENKSENAEMIKTFNTSIERFVNAFVTKQDGETDDAFKIRKQTFLDETVAGLKPELMPDINGKQFVVLTTGDLAATTNFDETNIPLFIAEQKDGVWGWSDKAITRKMADVTERKVVSYAFWQKLDDKKYVDFYLDNFNEMRIGDVLKHNNIFNENFDWKKVLDDWDSVTYEFNLGSVPYDSEVFNQTWLNRANSLISFAEKNQMGIAGNAFLWLHDIPPVLYSDKYTPEEKKRIFEFMVKSKMLKFKEVDNWVPFNEMGAAELWAPDNFKTLYKQLGGRELLVDIIKWAREINPQIKLIAVEDHLLDANNDATRQSTDRFNQILTFLEQKGAKVDAIESQDNLWTYAPPNPTDAQRIIQMYQDKGYEIYPAEMTITTSPQNPLWPDRPKTLINPLTQLEIFESMAEIYINSGTGLGLFSGTDNITWIHEIGATQEKPELFADQNYQPKPGVYLFRAMLLELLKSQSP